MDPLSITAGVVGILGATLSVGVALRQFLHGSKEAKAVVNAMISDVKALRRVLESMEVTFDEMDSDQSETGHVGTHWQNLLASLQDGQNCLLRLEKLLQGTTKDVQILDSIRRQTRLKSATEQIMFYRQEVQTYKDALHLSLQTITFCGQSLLKQDTTQLIVSSETIQQDIQRLATNLDVKLVALDAAVRRQQWPDRLGSVNNLKATVTSAATVLSSKTTKRSASDDESSVMPDYMSDFSDWFRSETSVTTLQWIYSDFRDQPLFENGSSDTASALGAQNGTELSRNSSRPPAQSAVSDQPSETRIMITSPVQKKQEQLHITSLSDSLVPPKASNVVEKGSRHRRYGSLSVSNVLRMTKREDSQVVSIGACKKKSSVLAKSSIKIVPVGDGACGKACFLVRASRGVMPTGIFYELGLWDTAGQEDYDRLRPLSYPDTDVLLMCFAIWNPDNLDCLKEKWIKEVRHYLPEVPIILVGLQMDRREYPSVIGPLIMAGQKVVTREQAEEVRKKIGAVTYLECSALTGEGCDDVMRIAVETILEREKQDGRVVKKQSMGLFSRMFRT